VEEPASKRAHPHQSRIQVRVDIRIQGQSEVSSAVKFARLPVLTSPVLLSMVHRDLVVAMRHSSAKEGVAEEDAVDPGTAWYCSTQGYGLAWHTAKPRRSLVR